MTSMRHLKHALCSDFSCSSDVHRCFLRGEANEWVPMDFASSPIRRAGGPSEVTPHEMRVGISRASWKHVMSQYPGYQSMTCMIACCNSCIHRESHQKKKPLMTEAARAGVNRAGISKSKKKKKRPQVQRSDFQTITRPIVSDNGNIYTII